MCVHSISCMHEMDYEAMTLVIVPEEIKTVCYRLALTL